MRILVKSYIITPGLFLFINLFSAYASTLDNSDSADQATRQAAELIKSGIAADKSSKRALISKLKTLAEQNPNNINVRKMYTNNLLAEGYYKEGLENLKLLNKRWPTRINLLTECMVKERLEKRDNACYKRVVQLSEKKKIIDSDYISALFFADDKRFTSLKNKLIKEGEFKESDFFSFTLPRDKLLREYFP